MTIICDSEWCEFNEDGYCEKEKVKIIDMSCASNRYRENENDDK
jgi:hypothetical protein